MRGPDAAPGAPGPRWRVWFDDRCRICRAGVAWIRILDRDGLVVERIALSRCLPAEGAPRARPAPRPAGASDEDLLRALHAEAPDGSVLSGVPALAAIAREFRSVRWVGRLAALPGVRSLLARLYRRLAAHRRSRS